MTYGDIYRSFISSDGGQYLMTRSGCRCWFYFYYVLDQIAGIYANRIRPDKPETKVIIAAPAVPEAFPSNCSPSV